jgi:DNA-binding transcriptional LysR family regulator
VRTPPTFARQILVPQLADFTSAHPEVELEVVLSIPFLDHAGAADADIEVRNGDDSVEGTPLMDDVVLPVAAPSLLAALPPLTDPAHLAHAPLLRTPLEPWAPWFHAAGLENWPEPASGPRLVDLGMTLEAAVAGQGIALARPSLAAHWLASGALVPLFGITARPATRYYLVPHAASGAAPVFARWLTDTCERVAREALEHLSAAR